MRLYVRQSIITVDCHLSYLLQQRGMSDTTYKSGHVYLLTNPVMPGLIKIGFTTSPDVEIRMKQIYSTGVPLPF
ncbi:GIY-YIG nuclease family protein [Gluconobacter sphaericus]|uniref:GIY-YIG nuclease family protein n=1 Tax=Gluconobacter sphaericus TaxID=574987 RepID=UPI0038D1EA0F